LRGFCVCVEQREPGSGPSVSTFHERAPLPANVGNLLCAVKGLATTKAESQDDSAECLETFAFGRLEKGLRLLDRERRRWSQTYP
jgi:hypothetical protein